MKAAMSPHSAALGNIKDASLISQDRPRKEAHILGFRLNATELAFSRGESGLPYRPQGGGFIYKDCWS